MLQGSAKPFIFVLMPFSPDFDNLYQLGIKATCTELGAYCERVDEQLFDGSIFDRICNQIVHAGAIVSEMTGKNPNVFYETGYAHALGKRVILLTKSSEDIPFDLKHFPHIVHHGKITDLRQELHKRLQWAIHHPTLPANKSTMPIEMFANGTKLLERSLVKCSVMYGGKLHYEGVRVSIDLHNPTETMLTTPFDVGLITDSDFTSNESHAQITPLPDNQFLHLHRGPQHLYPDGWVSLEWIIIPKGHRSPLSLSFFQATLVIFSEVETKRLNIQCSIV